MSLVINPYRFAAGVTSYHDAVMADSPLGYWRLGESAGATTGANEVGGGSVLTHRGTANPGVTGVISDGNLAASYPGTATNRSDATIPAGLGASGVTLEAWAEFAVPQMGCIIHAGNGTNGYGLGVGNTTMQNSGSKLLAIYEGVRWVVGPTITSGWHHIALTIVSGTAKFFIDGIEISSSAGSAPSTPSSTVTVGGYSAGVGNPRYFAGKIDEPAVYGTALSQAQLTAHVAAA